MRKGKSWLRLLAAVPLSYVLEKSHLSRCESQYGECSSSMSSRPSLAESIDETDATDRNQEGAEVMVEGEEQPVAW